MRQSVLHTSDSLNPVILLWLVLLLYRLTWSQRGIFSGHRGWNKSLIQGEVRGKVSQRASEVDLPVELATVRGRRGRDE